MKNACSFFHGENSRLSRGNVCSLFLGRAAVAMTVLLSLALTAFTADARKRPAEPFPVRSPFGNWAVGVGISGMGIDLSVTTPIHRSVMLRADYSFVGIYPKSEYDMSVVNLPGNRSFEMAPEDLSVRLDSHMLRLLVDWDPIKSGAGMFWLTGGIFFQNRTLFRYQEAYDTDIFADFGISGQDISSIEVINETGRFALDPDGSISSVLYRPWCGAYLGLRFGRPIPRRRVGFSGEIGVPIYVGRTRGVSSDMIEAYNATFFLPVFSRFDTGVKVHASLFFSLQLTFRLLDDK